MKLIRITTVPISLKVLLKGQLRFMSDSGFKVLGISSEGQELKDISEEEGIEVKVVEMSRKITPLKDLRSLWLSYCLFKKEKPTIVHSHTPKAGIIGMLAAKLAGVPIRLHTVAGMPLMEATGGKRKILDFVERLTYSAATKVYPNSKGLFDFIVYHRYTSLNKLKVIGNGSSNGINTSQFSKEIISEEQQNLLRNNLGIGNDDFVFVFVGRLVSDKGVNELVTAFCQLNYPSAKLLLVGPLESDLDPLHNDTLRRIDENECIISAGFQKDVRPYFAISNALVFPSYREGFPNVVMQAGAMELPAIVSDINGCNEIIIEEKNGTIIPVKNVGAIKDAMEMMITDKGLYLKMKGNARRMITERYEQQVVWDALLREYKSLLKDKGLDNV
ncbi:glycosyltransferase family 4 protein [Sphingobacterium sp. UBA5670]|uniref:glycosyltransferase family 4 protein n=1 Tax=Sphingobacterium sp. UBA5670 TaxID=1947502 RepID=UPI0025DE47F6|nr:glycosyltransferase family 4 protein [Sphingobacterium sp. UBA5670]